MVWYFIGVYIINRTCNILYLFNVDIRLAVKPPFIRNNQNINDFTKTCLNQFLAKCYKLLY